MNEPTYSIKEIMELQFKGIDHKLDSIVQTLREQTNQADKQFARLDGEIASLKTEVSELKNDSARYKVVLGIGATIGASLITFFVNRIF
jgi:peptidoglycan hydrolase CwlO-like protein